MRACRYLQMMEMDKYEYQLEQLAQRVRRLEADSLSGDESKEVQALMEDLDLIPAYGQDTDASARILHGESIVAILKDLDFACKTIDDFVLIETEEGKIEINFSRLPIVTVADRYRFNENEEGIKSMVEAANDINRYWDMVKVIVDEQEEQLLFYLDARHEDVASFRQSIRYYIEQILGAVKDFRERRNDYERDRVLRKYMSASKQIAS